MRKCKNILKNFGVQNNVPIFAVPKGNAEIAQLVERNLAKVEVAGPSPVFRSTERCSTHLSFFCSGLSALNSPPRGRHEVPGGNVIAWRRKAAPRVRAPFSAPQRDAARISLFFVQGWRPQRNYVIFVMINNSKYEKNTISFCSVIMFRLLTFLRKKRGED